MERNRILHTLVTRGSSEEILYQILSLAERRQSSYVCFANVHMIIEAYRNPDFNNLLSQADIVSPDGYPLALFMNVLYQAAQKRVSGPDLMVDLFKAANRKQLSLFFYGSSPEVLQTMAEKLKWEYPSLRIAGMISPPFSSRSDEEEQADIERIQASGAQFVLVALGCPKQERWMHRHTQDLSAVLVGVGAAFPFYTGQLKRAPLWMQEHCLEWLYRLYAEPKRLFKRYLVTNSLFVWLICGQILRSRISLFPSSQTKS